MKKLFNEIPHIKDESLELRRLKLSDAQGLKELTESEEVYRYLPTFLFEKQFEDEQEAISKMYGENLNKSLILGVFYDGEFCGLAEVYGYRAPLLKVSVGYRLIPRFWGKGIATKTLGAVVEYLLSETDIRIITASIIPENVASANVLKKNGFRLALHSVLENWGHPLPTPADKWIRTSHGQSYEYH